MIEAMIDIETLDTKPTAVVLSIGVVLFDGDREVAAECFFPDLAEQSRARRTVSSDTVLWWLQQDPSVFADSLSGGVRTPVSDCAAAIGRLLEGVQNVWANGPAFDLVILQSLFGDRTSWHYAQGRDMRTLREEAGVPRDFAPAGLVGKSHDPVYDCRYQIAVVREARWRLQNRKEV